MSSLATEEPTVPEAPTPTEPASPLGGVQNGGVPRRVKLSTEKLDAASKEELLQSWRDQELFLDALETHIASMESELSGLRESEERARQQHLESQHREKVLVRRLASKEQEMQDYASQLSELRAAQVPTVAALRSALLDPAANLLVQRLRQELAATKTRLEETQNELSAWKFTPDSNTGKRLMAKCRLLYQENEELGRVISSGRLAKLEGELALQKSFSDEVKKSQSELDEFLQDLDEDVEGMQGTIYFLQQQLKTTKEAMAALTIENNNLKQLGGQIKQEEQEIPASTSPEEKGEEAEGESQADWDEERTQESDANAQPSRKEEPEGEETSHSLEEMSALKEEKLPSATPETEEESDCAEEPPSKKTRVSTDVEEESGGD